MSATTNTSRLHKWRHDDYNVAKQQILQQLGTLRPEDLSIFGRQVLVGVYIRPNFNEKSGLIMTTKQQSEDIYQGKAVLVLAMGPGAFKGDPEYLADTYGEDGPPKIGDWLFLPSRAGEAHNFCADDGEPVMTTDMRGDPMRVYEWDGWPCRIVPDDQFVGRISKPHTVL